MLSACTAMLAKAGAAGAAFITIPLALGYLGSERFGIWMTITSFVMLLSFTDLGIGNGLMTAVSQASGRRNDQELRRLVASGLMAATLISCGLVALFLASYSHVSWADLLNVHESAAASEVGPAILVLVFCFALAMPFGIANRVQIGLQLGVSANLVQLVGAALSLTATFIAVKTRASLPLLVAAYVGGSVLAQILNSILFFSVRRPDLWPRVAHLSPEPFRRLLNLGFLFFLLQLALALGSWTDNLIVSRILSPSAVAEYSVPAKLYGLITIALLMGLSPLWPAYGEAMSRGDRSWARSTLLRSMLLATMGSTVAVVMTSICLPFILRVWIGNFVAPSTDFVLALSIVTILEAWRASVVMFLNGTGTLRLLIAIDLSFAVLCLGARVWLVERIGLAGIPLGAVVAYVVTNVAPIAYYLRRRLRDDLASA